MKTALFRDSILIVLLCVCTSFANNTHFLPGDAFFFARLDLQSARNLKGAESPILRYGSPFNAAAGCGYIGYEKIELTNMGAATKSALLDAFAQFENEPKPDGETNAQLSLFIYSKGYDWKKHSIGIQYNENWVDESLSFGTIQEHTRLGSFSEESIMVNWRDSALVDSLTAECPELPAGHGKEFPMSWSQTPIRITADECVFIIIPNRNFASYVHPKNGLELIEILDGKLTFFRRDNHEWVPRK